AINVARNEAVEAETVVDFHYLRNPIRLPDDGRPGDPPTIFVKTVYKNPGEAVKNQEAVVHLHSIRRLRAEGLVGVQYLDGLSEGDQGGVEPPRRRKPLRYFPGHRGEITAVAVSRDPKDPFIISGSEDGTARVWRRTQYGEVQIWRHPAAV